MVSRAGLGTASAVEPPQLAIGSTRYNRYDSTSRWTVVHESYVQSHQLRSIIINSALSIAFGAPLVATAVAVLTRLTRLIAPVAAAVALDTVNPSCSTALPACCQENTSRGNKNSHNCPPIIPTLFKKLTRRPYSSYEVCGGFFFAPYGTARFNQSAPPRVSPTGLNSCLVTRLQVLRRPRSPDALWRTGS